jgi:polar amino acid transport system substrate-binding protein
MQMIEQDRLDYGVMGYLSGLQAIATLQAKDIYAVEPPLIEKDLFLMLHIKHVTLIPLLNKTIDEMYADGTIANIYNELIHSLK